MGAKAKVTDAAGSRGRLLTDMPAGARAGTIAIALEDGRHVVVPHEHLSADADGQYRVDARFDDFEVIEEIEEIESKHSPHDDARTIPVAREELSVERRTRAIGRLRIDKRTETEEVMLDDQIEFDRAEVERVPIGRVVDEPPQVRREGDTIVIPVLEERLLKQVVLVEEVHVRRRRHTKDVSEPVSLRREEVDISHRRLDSDGEPDEPRPSR
jgi:stress response protein YsnF